MNVGIVKTDPKYKIALQLVNKILVNSGKNEIDDLTKFIDIDRNLIISDKNKKELTDMEKILFKHFNKKKFGWYSRNNIKNYILSFLRYMCNDIGLKFSYTQKDTNTSSNGLIYRKTYTYYSIVTR